MDVFDRRRKFLSVLSNPFSAESPSVDSEGGLDCQMTQNQGEVQDISVRWSSRWLAGDTTADHNGQKRWRNSSTVLDASAASDPSHPRPILLVLVPRYGSFHSVHDGKTNLFSGYFNRLGYSLTFEGPPSHLYDRHRTQSVVAVLAPLHSGFGEREVRERLRTARYTIV